MKEFEDNWALFIALTISMSKSKNLLEDHFELFLTPEEKEMLSSRFLIIKTLLEGKMTQREMTEKYNVSIAQITRGSNALKRLSPEYKSLLKKTLT